MDIHRCRFVPYPQSTINALSFSHSHISKKQKTASPRLAVGRANGDIELWNPLKGSWLQETIIRGGKDRSIAELVWTQDPSENDAENKPIIGKSRLFSVGYTTAVTEWDLEKGTPLRQASGNHGDIWCLAAQPPLKPETKVPAGQWEGQNLVTGCTDGALVLYSTKDGDLQFQKILVRPSAKKAKIISVAFQNRNVVIAGCTDSTIRVFDIRSGQNLRSMSLGAGPSGGPKNIAVWAVKALPNGDIISGDSTGELRVWSGKTYTLKQRIKRHSEDVYTLATSFDGNTIFSGGKDRKTVVYKQAGKGNQWAEVSHQRYHALDVTAIATLEYKGMSVIVSGGPDASPTIVPLQQYGLDNHRALSFLPQDSPVKSAILGKRRLLMSFWDREVHIWELMKPKFEETEDPLDTPASQNKKLVAKILIKGEANITSADISANGSLLVVSTITDVKVFQLRSRKSGETDTSLKISRMETPNNFQSGARLVQLSSDARWLCIVRADSQVVLRRIVSSASSLKFHPRSTKLKRLDRKIEKRILLGGLGSYDRTITQASFSADSRIFAVCDLAGYIDTFVLSGEENLGQAPKEDATSSSDSSDEDSDSDEEGEKINLVYGQRWTRNPSASLIPKLPSPPTVLSFRPATATLTNGVTSHTHHTRHNPNPVPHDIPHSEDRLLVVTAGSEVFEFEAIRGGLSTWSRKNLPLSFPEKYRQIRDIAKGCFWDVSGEKQRLWLYGPSWIFMFNLAIDFPEAPVEINGVANDVANGVANGNTRLKERKRGNKRKREGKEESSGAGSAIPDSQLGTGMSRKMHKIVHEELVQTQELPLWREKVDDEDEEAADDDALVRLPREKSNAPESEEVTSWHTLKYRPILGICVLRPGHDTVYLISTHFDPTKS
ncbi:WD40-repeat-containing domain protein [Bisporella sp. PMI_857]|nr:WD40-repeat-containing domain protein [Bisporella sp. PMI_857]